MDDEWNPDRANQLVRLTLNEIEQLEEKLSLQRAPRRYWMSSSMIYTMRSYAKTSLQ